MLTTSTKPIPRGHLAKQQLRAYVAESTAVPRKRTELLKMALRLHEGAYSSCNISRERRNTMATKKTTHSKKLHKAKKIEQKKPLSVSVGDIHFVKYVDNASPSLPPISTTTK
jgi:hypothetical protein